jgi:hypothetical protein
VLAYLSWHRPAPDVELAHYEEALERFHRSLAHRPPSGLQGSATFRTGELPWLDRAEASDPGPGAPLNHSYEDWYLLDGWSAVGVLEEAAVSQGHVSSHDAVAKLAGIAAGGVYRLREGHAALATAGVSVWVSCAAGHRSPAVVDLLGDGADPATAGLWRRCLGLGTAPEYCLLATEPGAGVAPSRLPPGWKATVSAREVVWSG